MTVLVFIGPACKGLGVGRGSELLCTGFPYLMFLIPAHSLMVLTSWFFCCQNNFAMFYDLGNPASCPLFSPASIS